MLNQRYDRQLNLQILDYESSEEIFLDQGKKIFLYELNNFFSQEQLPKIPQFYKFILNINRNSVDFLNNLFKILQNNCNKGTKVNIELTFIYNNDLPNQNPILRALIPFFSHTLPINIIQIYNIKYEKKCYEQCQRIKKDIKKFLLKNTNITSVIGNSNYFATNCVKKITEYNNFLSKIEEELPAVKSYDDPTRIIKSWLEQLNGWNKKEVPYDKLYLLKAELNYILAYFYYEDNKPSNSLKYVNYGIEEINKTSADNFYYLYDKKRFIVITCDLLKLKKQHLSDDIFNSDEKNINLLLEAELLRYQINQLNGLYNITPDNDFPILQIMLRNELNQQITENPVAKETEKFWFNI